MKYEVGAQLGNYHLLRLLGAGGFAQVYLAQHVHLETLAAIKIINVDNIEFNTHNTERFLSEARTLANLRHPSIVSVLDFDVQGGQPYLVMEYAAHGSLRTRYPKSTIVPLSAVAAYIKPIASALQYVHDHNIVHCDVKPENMLIGDDESILLSDFGIARVIQDTMRSYDAKDVVGTIYYMAPEQFVGKPVHASDQYALGVVAYYWLSGKHPFDGVNIGEMFLKHLGMKPTSLHELVPGIPLEVDHVIMKALAKQPQERYPTIAAFAAAFEKAAQTNPSIVISHGSPMPAVAPGMGASPFLSSNAPTFIKPLDQEDAIAPLALQIPPVESVLPRPDFNVSCWVLPTSILPSEAAKNNSARIQEPSEPTEAAGPQIIDVSARAASLLSGLRANEDASTKVGLSFNDNANRRESLSIDETFSTLIAASTPPQPPLSQLIHESLVEPALSSLTDVLPPIQDAFDAPTVIMPPSLLEPLEEQETQRRLPVPRPAELSATVTWPSLTEILPPHIRLEEDKSEDANVVPSQDLSELNTVPRHVQEAAPIPPRMSFDPLSADTLPSIIKTLSSELETPLRQEEAKAEPRPKSNPEPKPSTEERKIEIFISYSHRDRRYREALGRHLAPIKANHPATIWYDGEIRPGVDLYQEIEQRLLKAHIILLLISSSFIDSEYCNEKELKPAMERHYAGKAHVIPVILKPSFWEGTPFGKLRALPLDGKPIIKWHPRDDGYLNVVKDIDKLLKEMLKNT